MKYFTLNSSESPFENAIVLILVFILVIVAIHTYMKIIPEAKMAAFTQEVHELNAAIIAYRIEYGKFPRNLAVLAKSHFLVKRIVNGRIISVKKRFIKNIKLNKEGYPLTPFGTLFLYDKKEGRVLVAGKKT